MRGTLGHQRDRHSRDVFVDHRSEVVSKIQGGKSYLLSGRCLILRVASGDRTHTFKVAFEGASDGTPVITKDVTVGLLGDPKK